ncbi:hypothetical protein JHK87_031360 [Glycine soja]|nr:hypothetical protein JHK87_031360 [Glycine soja]
MAISQALPTSQATSKIVRGLSFESAKSTKLGTGAPTKKVKKSKRSTVVANVFPTRIDSLKKLSELTKCQSINDVIKRKILQSTRLTKLCDRLGFPKQPTSGVVSSVDKVDELRFNVTKHGKQPKYEINIRKHVLQQPKNEILTDDEGESPLTKFNLEEMQLPRMSKTNDIARYYWLEKGQVIKITRSRPGVDSQYNQNNTVFNIRQQKKRLQLPPKSGTLELKQ